MLRALAAADGRHCEVVAAGANALASRRHSQASIRYPLP